MEIIKVNTPRGLELKGAMFGDTTSETVVVMLTGICSNVFQNELLYSTGKLLEQNGIAAIIAQVHDSFSCFAYTDHSIGKQCNTGTYRDDFDMVYEDVESYVKYVRNLEFKNIILAGHSLGSNKIINYLGNTPDNFIDYFIVSSPVDLMHWWNIMPNIEVCYNLAKQWVNEGKGNDILPFLFGGFSPMTANTVLGFYNADNLKNCPVISKQGETQSLHNIKPNGSFIIGSKDSVTGDSPKAFMEQLNLWTRQPLNNQVIEVEGASHIFYGKHDIYAQTVLSCIQSHYLANKKEVCNV